MILSYSLAWIYIFYGILFNNAAIKNPFSLSNAIFSGFFFKVNYSHSFPVCSVPRGFHFVGALKKVEKFEGLTLNRLRSHSRLNLTGRMFRQSSSNFCCIFGYACVGSENQAFIRFQRDFFRLLVASIFSQSYELSQIKEFTLFFYFDIQPNLACFINSWGSYFDLLMLI